jgi:hypothetical protein
MPVTGEGLDPLLGKRIRVRLKDGADISGIFKVNLKQEQRLLLRQRGGLEQVIPYQKVERVDSLERKRAWWRRLLHR